MAVTLKQVAAQVGVSYQTVWRAIHDEPGILPETREAVLEAVSTLGYRPNRIAGGLRTRRSGSIGLIVLDVRDAHAAEVTIGVEEEAVKRGLSVLLANTGGDIEREKAAVRSLMERQVDGVILSPAAIGDHSYLKSALPRKFPLVAINRGLKAIRCTTVLSQDQDSRRAAQYLISRGHTEIAAMFGDTSTVPLRGRHQAFIDELKKHGIALRPRWLLEGDNTPDLGRKAVHKLFAGRRRPTALFTATSRLTEGALYGLRDIGVRQGHDVTMVGFDFRHASLLEPPLPVLSQSGREMGRLAVDVLIKLLNEIPVADSFQLAARGLE